MNLVITPGPLGGSVGAPPSKSAGHRAAICAALAQGRSLLSPTHSTDDMKATIAAVSALGANISDQGYALDIQGITRGHTPARATMDCGESGSTLRFMIPIAAALGVDTLFLGRGKLPQRPLTPLLNVLSDNGVKCISYGGADGKILEITGKLQSGVYLLPGDVSSQYITGLLFALPLLDGDSEIRLTTPLQSQGYVNLTLQALEGCGIRVDAVPGGWHIRGRQRYTPGSYTIESDYSSAAFWLCAGALAGAVEVRGLRRDSLQGDRAILDILERMGARVDTGDASVTVSPGPLIGTDIDVSDIPDLAPALSVVAACATGTSRILGAGRLRIKESDRLRSIAEGLTALGAQVEEHADHLVIQGVQQLSGGTADSFADHRIAMAMSIASVRCRGPVTVVGAECVAKSYPEFYDHFASLGGVYHVV